MRVCVALVLLTGTLSAQTILRGTVKDMAGNPVEGVSVTAHRDGTAVTLARQTELGGAFTFALPPGPYSVTTDRDPAAHHIEVAPGEEAVLDLAVPTNPTISGRVLDADRDPVKGAQVWLLFPVYRRGVLRFDKLREVTDAKGAYKFNGRVQANRRYYLLAVQPSDAESPPDVAVEDRKPIDVPTYYPSGAQFDAASPIVLQPGEQFDGADIKLTTAPYYCVDGKIRDKGLVIEESTSGMGNERGRAGENGVFRNCGLPAGSYRLVTAAGSAEFTVANTDVHGVDITAPAHLRLQTDNSPAPDGDRTAIILDRAIAEMRMAEILDGGQVKTVHIGPAPGDRGQAVAVALTSASGTDVVLRATPGEMEVPAGEYTVNTSVPGMGGVQADELWYNGSKLLDPVLRLTPGAAGTLRVAASPSTGELHVTIEDRADATVIVVPDSVTSVWQLSRLALHGRNDYKLPPGRYRVLATGQRIRWDVPDDLEKLLPAVLQGEPVDLDDKTPVQISVTPVVIY